MKKLAARKRILIATGLFALTLVIGIVYANNVGVINIAGRFMVAQTGDPDPDPPESVPTINIPGGISVTPMNGTAAQVAVQSGTGISPFSEYVRHRFWFDVTVNEVAANRGAQMSMTLQSAAANTGLGPGGSGNLEVHEIRITSGTGVAQVFSRGAANATEININNALGAGATWLSGRSHTTLPPAIQPLHALLGDAGRLGPNQNVQVGFGLAIGNATDAYNAASTGALEIPIEVEILFRWIP